MRKKIIALLAGGYSGEYVISIGSAAVAEKHIDADFFDVYKIIITKAGWIYTSADGESHEIDKNDFSLKLGRKKVRFDAVLMIIHGTPGEDGKLQGYFDMLGIPYTSCDATTSALTFNKRYTVATAAFSGVKVARSLHLFRSVPYDVSTVLTQVRLPVFVKPNNGGSSLGMSKVADGKELGAAIEKAFKEDNQVLIEEFIKGREITIGVIESRGEIVVLPLCEIATKKDFFDYEAKYSAGFTDEIVPAPIDETQAKVLRATARKVYQVFNCKGIVRIDFIWNEVDDQPYMLEINTVPGQSAASIVPKMVQAHGWTMREFYLRQIEDAIGRR